MDDPGRRVYGPPLLSDGRPAATCGGALLIGHRGAAADAPENTIPGLAAAVAAGCLWAEVDVMLTADGIPILMHDTTLDRTTSGSGPTAETTFAALRRLDAGDGAHVPTLQEALRFAAAEGLNLNLEIKPSRPDLAEATASATVAAVQRMGADAPGVLLSSFAPRAVAAAKIVSPAMPRALLRAAGDIADPAVLDLTAPQAVHLTASDAEPTAVADLHRLGLAVAVYTVNDPADAVRAAAAGCDAIVTDRPRALGDDAGARAAAVGGSR